MDKRWQLSFDEGSTYVDCRPLNGGGISIDQSRDLEKGQIFFRDAISGPLRFGNSTEFNDYDLIRPWEKQASLRCSPIMVRLQFKCAGQWKTRWTGRFAASSGKWNLELCQFEVKPDTVDRYTCLLDNAKVKVNLLQTGKVTSTVIVLPSLEFGACIITQQYPVGCEEFQEPGWFLAHSQLNTAPCDLDPVEYQPGFFWRERVTTECVGGSPVPPPGVGWTLLTNDCATTGTATYVRVPLITWTFGDGVVGTFVDGVPMPPDDDCFYVYAGSLSPSPFCPEYPFFICLNNADSETIEGSRKVEDSIIYLLSQLDCPTGSVTSDLFYWDPQGDAPGFVSGFDYVTGRPTQVNNLLLTQKTDFATPLPTNPATIGEMTFEDLMKMLNVAFQAFWDIEDDGTLRIEHWKYWIGTPGLDISDLQDVNERLVYTHLSEEIPRVERLQFMEAQSRDFVGRDIVYSGACVNGDEAKEYSPGKVTTDVAFVLTEPAAIARDGFVLTATSYNGVTYDTIIDNGALTGNFLSNAPLSVANLERDYWTWNRFLKSGNMNGIDTVFDGYMPNVEQEELTATMCCEGLTFDPRKTVGTDLAAILGGRGTVESTSFALKGNRINLTLRYQY